MNWSDLTKRSVPVQNLAGLSRHACIFVEAGVPFTCASVSVHALSGREQQLAKIAYQCF